MHRGSGRRTVAPAPLEARTCDAVWHGSPLRVCWCSRSFRRRPRWRRPRRRPFGGNGCWPRSRPRSHGTRRPEAHDERSRRQAGTQAQPGDGPQALLVPHRRSRLQAALLRGAHVGRTSARESMPTGSTRPTWRVPTTARTCWTRASTMSASRSCFATGSCGPR